MNDTEERILHILKNYFPKALITPATRLRDDLGIDSLDLTEIIYDTESDFDINFSDSDARRLITVADLIAHTDLLVKRNYR